MKRTMYEAARHTPKRQFVRIRLEPKIEYFLYKSQ